MKSIIALTMIALLLPAAALGALRPGPCDEDSQKFCNDVKTAGDVLVDCLMDHKVELSPACLAELDLHPGGPCSEDRRKFCEDVKAAGGDVKACLMQHKAELSAACKAKWKLEKPAN